MGGEKVEERGEDAAGLKRQRPQMLMMRPDLVSKRGLARTFKSVIREIEGELAIPENETRSDPVPCAKRISP